VITTQCAPLRGSYVSQTSTLAPPVTSVYGFGTCLPGYTVLSGGVYLSKPTGNGVENGIVETSIPTSSTGWFVRGESYDNASKLVSLEQCIR